MWGEKQLLLGHVMGIVTDMGQKTVLCSPDLERVHGSETSRKESLTISEPAMLLGQV